MSEPHIEEQTAPNPATTSWVPVGPGPPGVGVPTPVVNGQWLKGSGGAAVWAPITPADLPAVPGAQLGSNVNIAIGNATVWGIGPWPLVYFNNLGVFDGNSALGCPAGAGGIYVAQAAIRWAPNAGGTTRQLILRKNGNTSIVDKQAPPAAIPVDISASTMLVMTPGDYIQMQVYQDSGGAIDLWQGPPAFPMMSLIRVSQ